VQVFDDLLALTAAHMNVVPTTVYIPGQPCVLKNVCSSGTCAPDWRYLLKDRARGLSLVRGDPALRLGVTSRPADREDACQRAGSAPTALPDQQGVGDLHREGTQRRCAGTSRDARSYK
jgi:hypothetical protein